MTATTTRLLASVERVPDTTARVRHNKAVTAFHKERVGITSDLTATERGILALLDGLDQLVGSWAASHDPFMGAQIHGIATHAHALLNYDLGRLDAGTLSDALRSTCERAGVDADTGEWAGTA